MSGRRGVAVAATLIGVGILVSLGGMAAVFLTLGGEPHVAQGSVLTLKVTGDLDEAAPDALFGFAGSSHDTLKSLTETIRKAKADPRVTSLVVAPSALGSPNWGKLQEVRDAIIDFRASKKPVLGFLEYGGEREYYLVTACDRIFLMPTSPLNLSGLATYDLFLRGLFDKIGATPDFLHIGAYKTAPNQMTERTFTDAHREMRESLNRDVYEQMVAAIAVSRKRSVEEIRALVDQGPFLPEEALRVGLVDELAYEDQLDDNPKNGISRGSARLAHDTYRKVSAASVGLGGGARIAVINVVGVINSGRSGYDPMNGPVAGSETITEYIRKARTDAAVKAIILRVDSPGGSTIASDVIWRELTLTRQGNTRPIVASMSDLAASGGYYVAMAAPDIVAQPGTLTGSIGIYAGKVALGGTYEKLGMHVEALSIGQHAEMYSPVRGFNPAERSKLEAQIQDFYTQFVRKVAESRKMTPEAVDAVAQGRVWTGRQAKDRGLVDVLGGLDKAIALAKERAKIPATQRVELVVYPPRKSVFDVLNESFGGMDERAGVWALLTPGDRRAAGAVTAPVRLFRRGEPLALMPFAPLR